MGNVCVSAYDRANGLGRAKSAFNSVRNGNTRSCLPNDSADAVQAYQDNIPYMTRILEGIVTCDSEIHRHAIEQAEIGRACTTAFNSSQFRSKDTVAENYKYISRVNQLSANPIKTCEKIKFDEATIDLALRSGKYIYCVSKSQPMNPERNPIYLCNNYTGAKQCIEELKDLGCGYQLYVSSSDLSQTFLSTPILRNS